MGDEAEPGRYGQSAVEADVELVYGGKVVRAPVVDRGPFHRGIRYDLTYATARDLGAPGPDRTYGAGLVDAAAATLR